MQPLTKFKNEILYMGFRATLIFRKFKVDRNILIGKHGFVFILAILRSDVLMFHS